MFQISVNSNLLPESRNTVSPHIRVENATSISLSANQMKFSSIFSKRKIFKEVISLFSHETPKPHPRLEFIPPIPHLLTSNASPSDAERTLIQDAIEEVSATYEQIFATRQPEVLVPDSVVEFIRLHRSVLSTFRRLPNEIIGDIICQYSESSLVMDSYDGFWNNIVYPIAPSQVCQSWRSISLSLPHLWARLSIKAVKPRSSF